MSKRLKRPGPESTLENVRDQLIDTALALLLDRGVELGFGSITLSETIAAAGVSRSSAYRSLSDESLSPQTVLHRDLLLRLLTRDNRDNRIDVINTRVARVLDDSQEMIESGDIAARTRVLREMIRVGANTSFETVAQTRERVILIAAFGALQSTDDRDWRHNALATGEQNLTELFGAYYQGLASIFGYQARAPFTIEHLALSATAQVEGLTMRTGLNPYLANLTLERGGEPPKEWTLFAVAFEALFTAMCEPVDPDNPVADLTKY